MEMNKTLKINSRALIDGKQKGILHFLKTHNLVQYYGPLYRTVVREPFTEWGICGEPDSPWVTGGDGSTWGGGEGTWWGEAGELCQASCLL